MLTFLQQAFRDHYHTGAVLPSSPWLARSMTRSVRLACGPKRVLEVGPGTGSFTRLILSSLQEGDEFQLVEVNQAFIQRLEKRHLASFRSSRPEIPLTLHPSSLETAEIEGTFDYIVCSLPFKNFSPATVRSIFRKLLSLLAEDGELTFFEYAGQRAFHAPLVSRTKRRKLRRIEAINRCLCRRHQGSRKFVPLNILPAYAVNLKGVRPAEPLRGFHRAPLSKTSPLK